MFNFDEMLSELGKKLNLELAFDDDGACELLMDENAVITIVKNDEDGLLSMSSAVADELPDPVDYALVLDLLDFSLGAAIDGGPAVGRDPESGLLVAYQIITPSRLKTRSFADAFLDFTAFRNGVAALIADNGQHQVSLESFGMRV